MSKKLKRRRKRNNKPRRQNNAMDKHHLCYQRHKWGRGNLLKLREYWYCKIYLPKDTLHKMIHLNVPDIPAPKDLSAKSALEQLGYLEQFGAISEFDSIERRLELLASLFDCCDQPTADAFREQIRIVHEFRKTPP